MNPRVKSLVVEDDYKLLLTFTNNEVRRFDMKNYLSIGVFKELKDIEKFRKAKVLLGTIVWEDEQELCPDTLYEDSQNINNFAS